MENNCCPVCGKPGIPNYHKEDVVCPQCKSDLSIYRVINEFPAKSSPNFIWKCVSAIAIVAAVVCCFLFLNKKNAASNNSKSNEQLSQYKDSIVLLRTELQSIKENTPSPHYFKYVVRRGDSYWSISKKLYGTGTKADLIAQQNNRTLETMLFIGDTLKIE